MILFLLSAGMMCFVTVDSPNAPDKYVDSIPTAKGWLEVTYEAKELHLKDDRLGRHTTQTVYFSPTASSDISVREIFAIVDDMIKRHQL